MATEVVRKGKHTFEDFLFLVPDGQKADLLDGVIYMASPDNLEANDLNAWLCTIMTGFTEFHDRGIIYVSRVAYRLSDQRSPEPDLGFLPKELLLTRRRGYIAGPPAVAVAIVSPDSVYRDYVLKRKIYAEAGVREYWIIDPDKRRATFLCLHKGKFRERKPLKHIWRSEALPGFWLDVRWLWSARRARAYDVLRQLLGED